MGKGGVLWHLINFTLGIIEFYVPKQVCLT
jgi:hypothetical protein